MDIAAILQTIAVFALPVLFAITIHEAAHGYAARHFGDPTAWMLGRITLNPAKHIDPLGTIALPLLLLFATSGAFLFGYAKPVPVNAARLRRPKTDMVWVALAGPASNVVQALLWVIFGYLLLALGLHEPFLLEMAQAGLLVNLVLFVLNMLPLPPLDGGRILVGLLPPQPSQAVARIEPFGFIIVLVLLFTGLLGTYWLRPLMALSDQLIQTLLTPLRWLLL
ncbi:Zn-dependent protease [Serpentinimonas raichei]|uniref:Zn-dependent protease n=1 Tax=Serpentinimonas raichei TaxID=1458425 RepID=A0A060NK07_9BURK|nr:site-2 protease family protein [Serpentinimonas raichei]BAO81595.1 Zn-dependent protease [Serpentinimonas raichei]